MEIDFEQREFTRVPIRRSAEVLTDDRVAASQPTRDLSANGIYIEGADLPLGLCCRVRLPMHATSGDTVIETSGRIVRSEPQGVAIAFSGMDIDSFQRLRNLVLYNAADPARVQAEFENHLGFRRQDKPAVPSLSACVAVPA